MNHSFSEGEKLWILRQRVLRDAERSFFHSLSGMIHDVAERFQATGWKPHVADGCFQIYRPHWQAGTHYEFLVNEKRVLSRRAHVGLHVEKNTPHYRDVATRLFRCLEPHEPQLLKKYKSMSHGFRMPSWSAALLESDYIYVLNGSIDLVHLTSDQMGDALEALIRTESFVEEALFLSNNQSLWRTDFFPDNPLPHLEWGEKKMSGGQRFQGNDGRLGGPSLRIDGTQEGNYDLKGKMQPDDYDPVGKGAVNIMRLGRPLECEICNGDRLYLSCVVKTTEGGRLWFDGQGQPVCALFDVPGPPNWNHLDVPAKGQWQHLAIPLAPVCRHSDYDFARQGAHVFLISQTTDPNFVFSSIEIGRCSKGTQ